MKTILPTSQSKIIDKKNALIVWTLDENNCISDYAVYEYNRNQPVHENSNCPFWDLEKERIFPYSSGNCWANWNEWKLEDCLLEIFKYPTNNFEIIDKIFIELGKIYEWSERLSHFNKYYWDLNLEKKGKK